MPYDPTAILAGAALLAFATAFGMWPTRKLLERIEARHDLRIGSASRLRMMAGWSVIALWLIATWFCATIIGDWAVTSDLDGALARSGKRLEVVLRVAVAIMSSDG